MAKSKKNEEVKEVEEIKQVQETEASKDNTINVNGAAQYVPPQE